MEKLPAQEKSFVDNMPAGLKNFLLTQPLPDSWLEALRQNTAPQDGTEKRTEDTLRQELKRTESTQQEAEKKAPFVWKTSHNMALALVVVTFGALILYFIVS